MNALFNEFKIICLRLNKVGIIPTIMGSLDLEYVSNVDWNPTNTNYLRDCENLSVNSKHSRPVIK